MYSKIQKVACYRVSLLEICYLSNEPLHIIEHIKDRSTKIISIFVLDNCMQTHNDSWACSPPRQRTTASSSSSAWSSETGGPSSLSRPCWPYSLPERKTNILFKTLYVTKLPKEVRDHVLANGMHLNSRELSELADDLT